MSVPRKKLIVIGGGAAGFFCAINAARMNPALEVIILEKSNKVLSKVRVSGGGRCNVTHACFEIPDMIKKYPRGANFVKKAFHQFFTIDTIHWFEERGVKLKAEPDGRMFPVSNSSQTIIDCLLREAERYHINVQMGTEVKGVKPEMSIVSSEKAVTSVHNNANSQHGNKFVLELCVGGAKDYRLMTTDYLCIACGGYPKASMFDWLKETGHAVEDPVPSLFTFNMPGNTITELMGISVPNAKVKIAGSKLEIEGPLLITHWGLSGPAILKLSAWGARDFALNGYEFTTVINWLPMYNEQTLKEKFDVLRFEMAGQKIMNKNPLGLPARLWEYFLLQQGIKEQTRWADLPAALQHKLVKMICAQECTVKGKTTFKEEFVTAGGIKLNEVDPNTMMSKRMPGLFFAGEILDVDGVTGGFNFQHAWTSGWIAGKNIAAAMARVP